MATKTLDNPPSLNAKELHEMALRAHSDGHRSLKRFMDALRALSDMKLYKQLGYSGIADYADEVFHYRRTQTFEFIRVSRALVDLPQISQAFGRGELSFALVSKLTKVSIIETESEWLALAGKENAQALDHIIDEARKRGSKRPRSGKFGLPGMPVKVAFELAPAEHAVVEAALKKVAVEMSESSDGELPQPKEALLYLCQRILTTDDKDSATAGRQERATSPFTIIFHRCPDCAAAAVETEAMEGIEAKAKILHLTDQQPAAKPVSGAVVPLAERDEHNTPEIREQIRLRDGGRCANPSCRRDVGSQGHCHHIQPWSQGGRTELRNELLVCEGCHGLLHGTLLKVEGDPARGLQWEAASSEQTDRVRDSLSSLNGECSG
jgi:hypothetical protein